MLWLPFFFTFYNCCLPSPPLLCYFTFTVLQLPLFSTFNTITLNFMAAHCATPPQAREKRCLSEVKSSATWIAVKRDAVQPDALELCDASSSASVHCSASQSVSHSAVPQCIIEVGENCTTITAQSGQLAVNEDRKLILHPNFIQHPRSSAGLWMLSPPKISSTFKVEKCHSLWKLLI